MNLQYLAPNKNHSRYLLGCWKYRTCLTGIQADSQHDHCRICQLDNVEKLLGANSLKNSLFLYLTKVHHSKSDHNKT